MGIKQDLREISAFHDLLDEGGESDNYGAMGLLDIAIDLLDQRDHARQVVYAAHREARKAFNYQGSCDCGICMVTTPPIEPL